jgi:hypothetical protein
LATKKGLEIFEEIFEALDGCAVLAAKLLALAKAVKNKPASMASAPEAGSGAAVLKPSKRPKSPKSTPLRSPVNPPLPSPPQIPLAC